MLNKDELIKAKKLFPFFVECPTRELIDYVLRVNSLEWCSDKLLNSMVLGRDYAQQLLIDRGVHEK